MADVRTHDLSNGCRLLVRPTPDKSILAMYAVVRWGGRDDEADEAGRSNLMARLLTKGTRSRSAFEIANAMESVGGSIRSGGGSDTLSVEVQCVAEDWRVGLELLTDCLFQPVFEAGEFEKEKALVRAEILRAEDDKFSYAYKHFRKLFFKDHFYSLSSEGEVETVERLERESVADLHGSVVRPENVLLVVVGNAPEEALAATVEKTWPSREAGGAGAARREAPCEAGAGCGESLTLEKEVEQGFVIVGYRAPLASQADAAAMRMACGVLGEGMSARLFARLRDRDHLAYAVGSQYVTRHCASSLILYIGTGRETVGAARDGLLREGEALCSEPPTDEEFERARRYILGKHLIRRQTNSALASSMAGAETMGLGWQWAEEFPQRIKAVDREQVVEAARTYLREPAVVSLEPV